MDPMMPNDNAPVVDLRETVAVLLRRKWIILATAAVMTAAGVGLSLQQTKRYSASNTVVIRPVVTPAEMSNCPFSTTGCLGIELLPDSEAAIARSSVVASRVVKKLDPNGASLPGAIGVRVLTDNLLSFTATALTPEDAAQVANTFANEYLAYRREAAAKALRELADGVKQQMDTKQKELNTLTQGILELSQAIAREKDAAQRQAEVARYDQLNSDRNQAQYALSGLQQRYQEAQSSLGSVSSGGGEVVEPATAPAAPSSPKPMRNGMLAFILGLGLGVGIAFVRQHFDDRIRDMADASKRTGTLVLGVIPRSHKWNVKEETHLESLEDPGSPPAEAYRSLRQGLSTMGIGRELKTVLVTSGGAGAGKSTSTANLGVAFARTGLRTILVSADLRKPRLHNFFGLRNEKGLSDVLAGKIELDSIAATSVPNLWVLPSGAVPHNPSDLLDGVRLRHVFDKLHEVADVIIVDGPPLVAGADAGVISRFADTTLLLMRQSSARAGGAKSAVAELTKAGAGRIAAVLTMTHGRSGRYGGYGYGYGYGKYGRYGAATPDAPEAVPAIAALTLNGAHTNGASPNGSGSNGNGVHANGTVNGTANGTAKTARTRRTKKAEA